MACPDCASTATTRRKGRTAPAARAPRARSRPGVLVSRSKMEGMANTEGNPQGKTTVEAPMSSAIPIARPTPGPLRPSAICSCQGRNKFAPD